MGRSSLSELILFLLNMLALYMSTWLSGCDSVGYDITFDLTCFLAVSVGDFLYVEIVAWPSSLELVVFLDV